MDRKDFDYADGIVPEELTEEQKLDLFNKSGIQGKNQLLSEMEIHRNTLKQAAENDRFHSAAYYAVQDKLLEKLIRKTENAVLFKKLEDWWTYAYYINSDGGFVKLEHTSYVTFNEKGQISSQMTDGSFVVVSVPCKLLTVEEYAQMYKVEMGTVRQWIRRGKIRTAKKYGNEWRIPELTDIPQRGYHFGQYRWVDDLTDVPEGYEMLSKPALVSFYQDQEDSKLFHVNVSSMGVHSKLTLSMQEREKLELYLIAHPLVKYLSDDEIYG